MKASAGEKLFGAIHGTGPGRMKIDERWQTEALKAGYTDDPDPMTAVERVEAFAQEYLSGVIRANVKQNADLFVDEFNIHDELAPGELLPCPVCEEKVETSGDNARCEDHGTFHFKLWFPTDIPKQQTINATNAAIRELGK